MEWTGQAAKGLARRVLQAGFLTGIVLWAATGLAGGKAGNVVVLIADGCGGEQYTFARWFKGRPLSMDHIRVGAVRTFIADSVVADSAPAASAYATGVRTSDNFISVGPHEKTISGVPVPAEDLRYKPLATVLEGAKLVGKAVGVVSTSRVTHATPAAFYAHVPARDLENDIMEQLVYQNMDVVLGGGNRHLLPANEKGRRSDNENLARVLEEKGYRVIHTREELLRIQSGKVFGMFADSHMSPEIDRPQIGPDQPSLDQMTRKAIELLSLDPDGFFLMVEGSQIDWACHANDPAYLLSDLLAYDKAVQAALDFAKKDGNTLVLALSDHNTGGFSIGNEKTGATYSQMKTEDLLDPIRKMKTSSMGLWKMVEKNETPRGVRDAVKKGWGMDISPEEAERILSLANRYNAYESPHYAFGEVLCPAYTVVGWTTHGHTGGDVPLHAFGPGQPAGVVDAPQIARICAGAMGFDLTDVDRRLFVESGKAFADAKIVANRDDDQNPVAVLDYQGKHYAFPVNKNLMKSDGKETELKGVVVYSAETGKIYIPKDAVDQIKKESGKQN